MSESKSTPDGPKSVPPYPVPYPGMDPDLPPLVATRVTRHGASCPPAGRPPPASEHLGMQLLCRTINTNVGVSRDRSPGRSRDRWVHLLGHFRRTELFKCNVILLLLKRVRFIYHALHCWGKTKIVSIITCHQLFQCHYFVESLVVWIALRCGFRVFSLPVRCLLFTAWWSRFWGECDRNERRFLIESRT